MEDCVSVYDQSGQSAVRSEEPKICTYDLREELHCGGGSSSEDRWVFSSIKNILCNFLLYIHCFCSSSASVQSLPEDPRAAELASELDKINRALEQCEKQILSRLRAPLDSRNPTQDLADRLQQHQVNISNIMLQFLYFVFQMFSWLVTLIWMTCPPEISSDSEKTGVWEGRNPDRDGAHPGQETAGTHRLHAAPQTQRCQQQDRRHQRHHGSL